MFLYVSVPRFKFNDSALYCPITEVNVIMLKREASCDLLSSVFFLEISVHSTFLF